MSMEINFEISYLKAFNILIDSLFTNELLDLNYP